MTSPLEILPYPPRPFQAEALQLVASTAEAGGHLVLEAPTGTGKTIVLLAGALAGTLPRGRRVLYVTRTNSQQHQAIRELQALGPKTEGALRAFALQGRQRLCLKLEDARDPDLHEASAEELGHYCRQAKRLAESDPADPKACDGYGGLLRRSDDELRALIGSTPTTAEALKAVGRVHGVCSYEATKRLLPQAHVVVAPYVFAFDPGLRARLFDWWHTEPGRVALVVDEAHNLPPYLRELASPRLGKETLRRALGESETLHHPIVGRDASTRTLLETLAETFDRVLQEYARDEDGFIPPFEVEADLLHRFRWTTAALHQAGEHLVQLGEIVKDRRRQAGKVPRSALAHVGAFLLRWMESDEEAYVKLAVREPRPALEAFCVDAARAAQGLHDFHATVHASGTLAPLSEYRDALGLGEAARLERFPSPFPEGGLTVVAVRGLTTRYEQVRSDPRLVDRLQDAVRRFLDACRVSAAVFFPSHQLLEEFREVGALDAPQRQVLVEARDLSQERLMQLVAAHRRAPGRSVIAGVLGGRLSEGLDFPGRELEAVCVVGVPFPKPTARQRSLFHYFEAHHGRGWEYAVRAPATRRLRQALGRLIRSADDRGFALVLDERAPGLLAAAGVDVALADIDDALGRFAAWQAQPRPVDPRPP